MRGELQFKTCEGAIQSQWESFLPKKEHMLVARGLASSAVCFITDYKVKGFQLVCFLHLVPNQTSTKKQPSLSILLQRPSCLNNLSVPIPQDEVHSRPCYLCRRRLRSNHRWHSRMCSYLHRKRCFSRWLLVRNWRRMRLRKFQCCSEWLY